MLPNLVSLYRVAALPVLLWSLRCDGDAASGLTLALLGTAAISDLADGWLARRLGRTSRLGQILDPLADKVFLGGLAIGLVLWRDFPVWLLVLLLARDAAITVAGFGLLRRRQVVIPANLLGKVSTAVMSLTAVAHVLAVPVFVRQGMAGAAALLLVASGLGYLRALRQSVGAAGTP
jgi:CDP-diacylglycerol--glycerol-3-phosphate 3-phosphatidyltransferase